MSRPAPQPDDLVEGKPCRMCGRPIPNGWRHVLHWYESFACALEKRDDRVREVFHVRARRNPTSSTRRSSPSRRRGSPSTGGRWSGASWWAGRGLARGTRATPRCRLSRCGRCRTSGCGRWWWWRRRSLLKTELAINAALHAVDYGDDCLFYEPDQPLLERMFHRRLRPALKAIGTVDSLGLEGAYVKKRDSRYELQLGGGGGIIGLTPMMKTGLSAMAAPLVVIDELDKMLRADMMVVASERSTTYGRDAKVLVVSTPTVDALGRVWREWLEREPGRVARALPALRASSSRWIGTASTSTATRMATGCPRPRRSSVGVAPSVGPSPTGSPPPTPAATSTRTPSTRSARSACPEPRTSGARSPPSSRRAPRRTAPPSTSTTGRRTSRGGTAWWGSRGMTSSRG